MNDCYFLIVLECRDDSDVNYGTDVVMSVMFVVIMMVLMTAMSMMSPVALMNTGSAASTMVLKTFIYVITMIQARGTTTIGASAMIRSQQDKLSVPDRRRRIVPEVVLVRRWVIGVLGIWRGEGLGKGLGQGRSVQAT
jgi:hypothetical protein